MAATEVEDLAALVGIEILPDNANEEQNVSLQPAVTSTSLESDTRTDEQGSSDGADLANISDQLSALEEEFADRYTSTDTEFMQTLSTATLPPPCIASWWANDRRNDRSRGGRRGQGWGRGRGRGRDHHASRSDYRDRWDAPHQRSQGHRYHGHHHYDDRRDHYRDQDSHGHRERSPVNRH